MTKICCISDTHGFHRGIPHIEDCDILIHAGDWASGGTHVNELMAFLNWFNAQPATHKVLIAGNHDWIFEREPSVCRTVLSGYPSVTYLEDSGCEIMGLKFWGSPWSKRFMNWAFNADPGEEILKHWNLIPNDTDVLVTHGPPFGYLDKSNNWNVSTGKKFDDCLGDRDLRDALYRVMPELHVFGHIHGSGGTDTYWSDCGHKTTLVNASMVDEGYQTTRKPIYLEL